ncbi:glyoxalase/bleomycin resistance protein/dioxygenase [Salinarchaeum sp. Harcht-Bsk1]|uniref:VOC family protein n=1 Tax=Salinarchaeum sp. Harcht-Bsk1 TaxID=1333523 RepID=UPI0003424741|nr:VOC family protein [Salinarchaeum sp. Harcht-Bsk1]AGN01865.1 glyoxalase/bleomycin resistance protein/dioxygenase [Salinarchaeum sp. Harcht-Bsk1]
MADLAHVNFACADPADLADFWAAALDAERLDLLDDLGLEIVEVPYGPELMFREAPRGTDRDLPIHLDLHAEDRKAEVDRLEQLGAAVRETKTDEEHGTVWTVLEDPAGNGFCVSEGA